MKTTAANDEAPRLDESLLLALVRTLDRVDYALGVGDDALADVMGGVVEVLLEAPGANMMLSDLRWRRQLARWERLRATINKPPPALVDFVRDRARIYLIEAARAAGEVT